MLAFYITGTVFANESSQGFRRFEYPDGRPMAAIVTVEDFAEVAPFDDVTNHPTLLIVREGSRTQYPVPYIRWSATNADRFDSGEHFRVDKLYGALAQPIPGMAGGPWLKGTRDEHEVWAQLLDAEASQSYRARKGVTTDRNGIYFVSVTEGKPPSGRTVTVANDPRLGRIQGIPTVRMQIESDHVFPLIRGRGVSAFRAEIDPNSRILVPQRGMYGDAELPVTCPRTFRFFSRFQAELRRRSSFRKFQQGQPFWSIWSTGEYTFSPYNVVEGNVWEALLCGLHR